MTDLQPFDKHQANVADLRSCGSTLVSQAADGITNGKLTKQAYSPALTSVTGMCSPQVENADRAVQQGSQNVTGELAWAAIVTQYWATQVSDFNAEVDRITSTLDEAGGGDAGADDPDGDSPTTRAKRDWWTAYYNYIEGGQSSVTAMLRDGPTKAHMQTAIDAGVMPGLSWEYGDSLDDYWNNFMGIWTPPDGDRVDQGIWLGKLAGLFGSWTGHGMHRFASQIRSQIPPPYAGFANTGWRSYFNPGLWVPRSGLSYGWARAPFPLRRRTLLPHQTPGRFDRWRLPWRRELVPVTNWSRLAGVADKGFYALSFAGGAYDQWTRDSQRTDLSTGEKVTRSATRGAVKLAGTYAGIETGAYVGMTLGSFAGPGGAVIGSMVGGLVGGVIGSGVADDVADYAVEAVTDPVETVKDIGSGIKDVGEDIGDAITFWD